MAIYHLSASIVKRSAGRSVTAAAAYRAGSKIEDLTTGLVHDYTRKQGIDHSEILSPISANLGNEWLLDREQLWNQAEQIERRKDAQLAREITLAIPRELDRASKIELIREYVKANFVEAGMIADINIHHIDGNNPHAHILLTMRNLKTNSKGELEFGLKNTDWNSKDLLLSQRKSWEQITNKYLAAAGSEAKIDCRSLAEQGSPFIPQIHVGVHATAMKRKGIATDRSEEYDQIEASNNDIRGRLERIYEEESAPEPKSEVKPELTEQQQQIETDFKLAELIIQVMSPTSKETQTFGVYTIKPYNNGYQVRTNNNHNVILNLKLENDIWVKSIRYHIKGNQRKHIYSNSDIDAKVEDFTKVIEDHQRKVNDLKIQNEAEKERIKTEKERIKTEIQIQKVNKEKAKAEAQIKKINNERLKPQKAEERRVRMEAQKIETKQRNLKKAEARADSEIIANAERQVRMEAQRVEARKREIERDKIRKEEAKLASERRKAERERVTTELNKIAESVYHLLQDAMFVKFEVEGNTLELIRHNVSCIKINTDRNWYTLYLDNNNNCTISEDYYNTQSIDDICKTIEKCRQVGTLIFKREKESEPATTLLDEEVIVTTPILVEKVTPNNRPPSRSPIRDGNPLNHIHQSLTKALEQERKSIAVQTSTVIPAADLSQVIEPIQVEKELSVSKPVPIEEKLAIFEPTLTEEKLAVSETKEINLELRVVEDEQIKEVAKVQQPTRKVTQKKKREYSL